MPETVILSTLTNTTRIDSDIEIYTYYQPFSELPDIIQAFIAESPASLSGVGYVEGEGIVEYVSGGASGLTIYINESTGEVSIDSSDATSYSIDSATGQLQYTT